MFKHYERAMFLDLSSGLRGAEAWDVGALRGLYFHLDVCTLAIEPSAAILAVGGYDSLRFGHILPLCHCQVQAVEWFIYLEAPVWN